MTAYHLQEALIFFHVQGMEYFPSCAPCLPSQIMENDDLRKRVLVLASTLDVRGLFYELEDIPSISV